MILVATRSRPEGLKKLIQSYKDTNTTMEMVFSLDDNEYLDENMSIIRGFKFHINSGNAIEKMNRLWEAFTDSHYIMGADDIIYKTPEWDKKLKEVCSGKYAISYGNDGIQDGKLPTHPMISRALTEAIGGYFPPHYMKHLYVDNCIKFLGDQLGIMKYVPEVEFEHNHFVNEKAEIDECYKIGNSRERYMIDEYLAQQWINDKGIKIVNKIRGIK